MARSAANPLGVRTAAGADSQRPEARAAGACIIPRRADGPVAGRVPGGLGVPFDLAVREPAVGAGIGGIPLDTREDRNGPGIPTGA